MTTNAKRASTGAAAPAYMAPIRRSVCDKQELLPLNGGDPKAMVYSVLGEAAVLAIYALLAAGQVISVRATARLPTGLGYDPAAAVAMSELVKFSIAVGWTVAADRGCFQWPLPRAWAQQVAYLVLVSIVYTLANQLTFPAVSRLGATLYGLLANLKIVFTSIFLRLLLGRRFAPLQWLAIFLLTFSGMVLVLSPVSLTGVAAGRWALPDVLGLACSLGSAACAGYASVLNERVLQAGDSMESKGVPEMPFMAKNAVMYAVGVLQSLATWRVVGTLPLSACLNGPGLASVGTLAALGLTCAVVLRYLGNVARCFCIVLSAFLTAIWSEAVFHEGVNSFNLLVALLLFAASIVLYQAHNNPNLYRMIAAALAGACVTYGLCRDLASRSL